MPKVPVYQPQVNTRTGQAPVPTQAPVVEGAFGAQVDAARGRLGEEIMRTGDIVSKRLLEMQIKADDQEVLNQATAYQRDLQKTLNDTTTDPDGVPKGLLARNLGQTRNITIDFDQQAGELGHKYLETVKGPNQREQLGKLIAGHSMASREQVIRHEATEREKDYNNTVKAAQDAAISTASNTTDPESLGVLMGTNADALRRSLTNRGEDAQTVENKTRVLNGELVKAAFTSVLDTDPQKAKRILESHGASIPGPVFSDLKQKLDGKLIFEERQNAYNEMSQLRDPEGFPDETAMETAIRVRTDLSPEKKEDLNRYVQSRAAEERTNITRARSGADRLFTNAINEGKQNGQKMDEALKLVPSYAYDPTDRAAKELYIQKLYSGPQETNPTQYIGLWEGIQNKIVSRRDIDTAFMQGYLKATDWEALRKEHYRMTNSGESPEDKDVRDRVKVFADQSIHNKKDRDAFLYTWQEGSRGMPAAQKFTYSQDLMKSRDSGKWYKPNKPEYKTQLQVIDADRSETGNLYKVLGQDEVNSIARGVMATTGKPKWGVADVNAFAAEFGGPAKIVPGTPVHNAIQSLNRYGKRVTAASVKKALENRPDGKF